MSVKRIDFGHVIQENFDILGAKKYEFYMQKCEQANAMLWVIC